jgi:hypothetical protein
MNARLIIPTAAGELVSYDLVGSTGTGRKELRIVFSTSEETFERWLFYMMRDIGGHVVTNDPRAFRSALGLGEDEAGVVDERKIDDPLLNRHPATA